MIRLDLLMVARALAPSRTLASRLIEGGFVTVNGTVAKKASQNVRPYDRVEVLENHLDQYVSRGGLKLEHALRTFSIHALGKTAFDFGASTGGFCDCLLKHGVLRVYAVDVGSAQLHEKIRGDVRVTVLEQTDARDLTEREIPEICDLGVIDVSFISQGKLYESAARFLRPGGELVTLYKPQFEVGRSFIGKGGIVRPCPAVEEAFQALCRQAEAFGLQFQSKTDSPILGGDGNREALLYFVKKGD